MRPLIGIDPGWGGGLAFAAPDGAVTACKMPDTELGIWNLLRPLAGRADAVLELVHAMGTNGCKANFALGRNKGSLVTAMRSLGIEITEVSPVLWMKRLQPLTTGPGKARTERKRQIKEKMKAKYPHLKLTNATADAVAVLDYALEQRQK